VADGADSTRRRPRARCGEVGGLGLRPYEGNQQLRSEDVQRPFQVVRQGLQAHFRSDPRQGLGQEVSGSHPRLERSKRMLDGWPTQPWGLRSALQPVLHVVQHLLVFPARDSPVIAGCASRLDRATRAGRWPVAVHRSVILDRRHSPDCPFAGRAKVLIAFHDVDEVATVVTTGPPVPRSLPIPPVERYRKQSRLMPS
jgi:hypothetical protein